MLSGTISTKQDLVDLINGYLANKAGILDLYLKDRFLSLYLENGLVVGFYAPSLELLGGNIVNKKSLLLYHFSDVMQNTGGFFTFRKDNPSEAFILMDSGVSVEELVLQSQLVEVELKTLLEGIITPYAVLRVIKPFPGMENYDGKSFYTVLALSEDSLIESIRKLKDLIAKGFVDVYQFYHPEEGHSVNLDVVIQDVELSKVKLLTLLENFHYSRFTGVIKIRDEKDLVEIYYIKGKLVAVYPVDHEVFYYMLGNSERARITALSMDERLISLYMLRHLERKAVSSLELDFIELGKVIMGMNKRQKSGIVTVYSSGSVVYMFFDKGRMMGVVEEKEGSLRLLEGLELKDAAWMDLIFESPMENISLVVHLLLINILYGIILRHSVQNANIVMNLLASSDSLKYEDGQIKCRKYNYVDKEEVTNLLNFLLDMADKVLGKKKLEEELETLIQPYREVFKILNVEDIFQLTKE